jgi:hypothetical protein
MTRTETRKSEVRCCYLIFASIEDICGSNGASFCTSTYMTRTETRKIEVRCCYLIFASIEDICGSNGASFCTSYLGDTADLIFTSGAGALNHARTYDTTCQGVRITPIRCRSSLRWWDVGNTYAAVSESEVICDLRCGLKAEGSAPVGFHFEGVRNTPIWSPPVTSLATGAAISDSPQAARQY